MREKPPQIIDSAKVLKYAIVDKSIQYTGRLHIYANGKELGKVPRLAICQNYKAKDNLLFLCNKKWKVLGVAGFKSMKATKDTAEETYQGISKRWATIAKPNVFKNWPGDLGPVCSFCRKTIFEGIVQLFQGDNNAYICDKCVSKFQQRISEI
jgi:ClpX C4-type zinc finger protein